jgi:hypothetical protein
VAGAEGIMRVHIPFFLTDLSQIEKHLGSFTTDTDSYVKEFQYWLNPMTLLGMTYISLFLPPSFWRRDKGSGMWIGHMQMRSIAPPPPILLGLWTSSYWTVNFDELREIVQRPTENPADFLGCLTEALNRQRMALKPPREIL